MGIGRMAWLLLTGIPLNTSALVQFGAFQFSADEQTAVAMAQVLPNMADGITWRW
jgi:hypothetical protein